MDKLPSKSLSKSILVAVPLFCLVLAILDAADQLSYLFILEFLGNIAGQADIVFLPTNTPTLSTSHNKYDYFNYQGIDLTDNSFTPPNIPLVRRDRVQQWADKYQIIRGCTPRWLIPLTTGNIDSILIVANVSNELAIGLGLKSGLGGLGDKQIGLSNELLQKLSKRVGDKVNITFSVQDLFKGRRMIEKYKSVQSEDQARLQDSQQQQIEQLQKILSAAIQSYSGRFNLTVDEQQVKQVVKYIYNLQFSAQYTIKYSYQNNGLYSSQLNNVMLIQYNGFARFLHSFIKQKVFESKTLKNFIYTQIDNSDLDKSQKLAAKTFINLNTASPSNQQQLYQFIRNALQDYPLTMHVTLKNRQLVYHPSGTLTSKMYTAMENSPKQFQVVSVYPFFQDLDGIRFFFKSVIQIFTFICLVIFFNTMRLILKQVYEQKEIQVGIWRTLGAGGVKQERRVNISSEGTLVNRLKSSLGCAQKINYIFKMLVKVGFFYYWLASVALSTLLYLLLKILIYNAVANLFKLQQSPPQYVLSPIILFFLLISFIMVLVSLHLRQIYVNPLVSTIKPLKRTFDVVKIRVIKIATFGITIQVLIIGILLVYYGVVSYYWIPLSILQNDGYLQTILFNSIFIFMILGSIMVLVVTQSRIECLILNILFYFSKYLSTLKLMMLKSIKAKQYKNLKVSLIISLIFAFLLFFAAGIKIELKIIQSFTQRQLGADLVIQNFQNYLNRTQILGYLDTIKGIKYAWFTDNIENNTLKIGFETFTRKGVTPKRVSVIGISANFMDVTLNQYYYPEYYYQPTINQLQALPNGIKNGFNTIYKYDKIYNNQSIGMYDPNNTMIYYDPNKLNLAQSSSSYKYLDAPKIPPNQQIINVVMTTRLRKRLGLMPGDTIKMFVNQTQNQTSFYLRCRMMHSLKMMPGIDYNAQIVFMSQTQAKYIQDIVGYNGSQLTFYKLFVSGVSNLQQIGNKIVNMSPEHTLLFNIQHSKLNFQLLQTYLNGFVLFVTVILTSLSVLFLAVYTHGKCKQEAENFKMLRAIGLSVFDIRLMIFLEVLVRIVVSIAMGIVLGIIFSLGLSGQIEEILMLKAPMPDLSLVLEIAGALLIVFSLTVVKSTHYLTKRTVSQTAK